MVVYPRVPQWIALDFGETLTLTGIEMTVEGIKQEIDYGYEIAVSQDGESWDTVKQVTQRGLVHEHQLDAVEARHLRIKWTEGGGRYISLTDLKIRHRENGDDKAVWAPPGCEPLLMQRVLPDHRPTLELLDEDGQRVRSFTTAWRRVDDADVVAIASRGRVEQQVTAVLHREGVAIEDWNLDSGERSRLPVKDGKVMLTFSPWESRLLVLRSDSEVEAESEQLPAAIGDRRRQTLAESTGPWPIERLRANALPLVGLGVEMADPAYPDDWMSTEDGSIPKPAARGADRQVPQPGAGRGEAAHREAAGRGRVGRRRADQRPPPRRRALWPGRSALVPRPLPRPFWDQRRHRGDVAAR